MASEEITRLLDAAAEGDAKAVDLLMPMVYEHLRAVAGGIMGPGAARQTLQPTALVNEAYVKLVGAANQDWAGRTHFFAVAATAMRQILIDHARKRKAAKRGGNQQRVTLDAAPGVEPVEQAELMALTEALEALHEHDPRAAQIVELRFFAGMTNEQVAAHLGVSERTVRYDWRHARAWLVGRLSDTEHTAEPSDS